MPLATPRTAARPTYKLLAFCSWHEISGLASFASHVSGAQGFVRRREFGLRPFRRMRESMMLLTVVLSSR